MLPKDWPKAGLAVAAVVIASLAMSLSIGSVPVTLPIDTTLSERQLSAENLLAQKTVAQYAIYTFGLGVATLIASALGLIFVVRTFDLQRRTTMAELRPYLTIQSTQLDPVARSSTGEITTWRFTALWENSGVTPAKNAVFECAAQLFPAGSGPRQIAAQNYDTISAPTRRSMPIAASHTRTSQVDMPSADLVGVVLGSTSLYWWGWIEYSDGFPATPRRRSEFCVQVLLRGHPLTGLQAEFVLHTEHNGMDETALRPAQT